VACLVLSFFLPKVSVYLGPSPGIEPTIVQPAPGSMISRVLQADGFVVVEHALTGGLFAHT